MNYSNSGAAKLYSTDPEAVNYARPEYVATVPDLALIGDELGGTRAMHEASAGYIRQWKAEDQSNYDIRRKCETFFEGFGRTLSAAVGMLFARAPQIDWNRAEAIMEPDWENIDGAGNHGNVFAKRFGEAALRDGLAAILIDHTRAPRDEQGQRILVDGENEGDFFLRPTWSLYTRVAAINWLDAVVGGERILTRLVLVEPTTIRDGVYGTKCVRRYRVLGLLPEGVAAWQLWEQIEDQPDGKKQYVSKGTGVFTNASGQAAARLPVAIAYTGRSDAIMQAKIPLLGVAWANLAHWQLSTSLRFNSEVAGFAQPVVVGHLKKGAKGEESQLAIGPLVKVHVEEGGDFKWAEPAGTGLDRLGLLVVEKLKAMAMLGVSFMQTDTRSAETAEAKRLDAAAENSTLATAAQGIEDALNQALEIHAWYRGIDKAGAPTLTISRDFENTVMAADVMGAYVNAMREGLPVRVMLEAWQAGGRIPADTNLDEIEEEMQLNKLLADAAAEEERNARLEEGAAA